MSGPLRKRHQLAPPAGTKCVTDAALAKILETLNSNPDSLTGAGQSRRTVGRALGVGPALETAQGNLFLQVSLPIDKGGHFKWDVFDPAALLNWSCQLSDNFCIAFESLLRQHPCSLGSPLSLIVYVDEAAPGDLLAQENTRKSHCWYWAFEEWGAAILSREECWFIGGILRSSKAKKVKAGARGMFKHWLKLFFGEKNKI